MTNTWELKKRHGFIWNIPQKVSNKDGDKTGRLVNQRKNWNCPDQGSTVVKKNTEEGAGNWGKLLSLDTQ